MLVVKDFNGDLSSLETTVTATNESNQTIASILCYEGNRIPFIKFHLTASQTVMQC